MARMWSMARGGESERISHSHNPGRRPYNTFPMPAIVRSFAKINLGLRIGATRPDGFHELLTVYQTIDLHDRVGVTVEHGSSIQIRCDDPRVPTDNSNTCFRIAERVMRSFDMKRRIIIDIEKRLPIQGGLGGASSNAVAALLGLERALKKTLSAEERLRIAAEVGSDLPLFLIGGTVLGIGRGEQVYPLEDLPATPCVIVTPDLGVSTPKAFADWDRSMREQPLELRAARVREASLKARAPAAPKLTMDPASVRMAVLGRGLSAWLSEAFSGEEYSGAPLRGRAENPLLGLVRAGIENDFEQVVFSEYPKLGNLKRALLRSGARYASLSGSGSTLYGLFTSQAAAARCARVLRKTGSTAQATATLTRQQYWSRIFG